MTNTTLIDEQHGFRPSCSAITCNFICSNFKFDAFLNYCQVDVIYTDFTKTFDNMVGYKILGKVLDNSGFGEPLFFYGCICYSFWYKLCTN